MLVGPPGNERTVYEGDLLVHRNHGLCRFEQAVGQRTGDARRKGFLLQFADQQVTLPLGQAELLTRYKSREQAGENPKLAKFTGRRGWSTKLQKAKLHTDKLAKDIMMLYADRDGRYREPCLPDGEEMWAFEAGFHFQPTPDQQTAFEAVMKDMVWRKRPMDRLICGDVGFGKTEVAMRAIYRAVRNGRQVALLAPTTVLAAQHLRTLRRRMPDVAVECLRGGNTRENRRTKERLAAGELEVVVGTHALLGNKVAFQRLGLVVVDEEQRFGVAQKEKLKAASADVDVLTLSATPIPRTLQMSLSGLRDMSSIYTAPEGRQNVSTTVARMGQEVIREAIQYELDRDGQVFYVVPRVAMVEEAVETLQQLVPGVRVAVCHGQMKGTEDVIVQFTLGSADVLVATTIIENGLDIPNVNTIVVQNADMLGLSQLYQLRGRVGRSNRDAHAYLLHGGRGLTSDAMMRLAAMKQMSTLGCGREVARRDLDIRGAGSILSTKQKGGGVGEFGLDLYMQVLEESMAELRGTALTPALACAVALPGLPDPDAAAHLGDALPAAYIPDPAARRQAYNRARVADTREELVAIAEEWNAAYGPPPARVKRLLKVRHLQVAGRTLGVERIAARGADVVLSARGMEFDNWETLVGQVPARAIKHEMAFDPREGTREGPEVVIQGLAKEKPTAQVNYLLGLLIHLTEYVNNIQKRTILLKQR